MQVKGYAAKSSNQNLEPFEFKRRAPGPKDILIAIEYCGVCHSDIHQVRNEWQNSIYPVVPGHEIVGIVKEIGSNVSGYKIGDRVGVGCLVDSCRTCQSCKDNLENYCETGFTLTYNSPQSDGTPTFGGYSTHIVVDQDFVLRVPPNLDPAGTAPLLCAGITTYSPMKHVGVSREHKIAVVGLGGLGHMAVKLAVSFGAEVTVFSRSEKKKTDALRLGAANYVISTNEDEMAKVENHFDFVLDTVSAKHDVNALLMTLKREGTLLMVGASDKPLDLNVFPLIFKRRKIMGSLIGGIKETQEMLNHCGKHNIVSEIELIQPNQINEAYEKTLAGQVKYRFVIDCNNF